MELYDTFEDFFRDCPAEAAESGAVRSALLTAWEKLRGAGAEAYRSVMVAVSGGADNGKKNIM